MAQVKALWIFLVSQAQEQERLVDTLEEPNRVFFEQPRETTALLTRTL